jgi:hypothetical protein
MYKKRDERKHVELTPKYGELVCRINELIGLVLRASQLRCKLTPSY